MKKETKEIYDRCDRAWTPHSQLLALAEEAAELSAAVNRYLNNKCDMNNVEEEAADVLIMLENIIMSKNNFDEVKNRKLKKLDKKLTQLGH